MKYRKMENVVHRFVWSVIAAVLFAPIALQAMVYDNRFFPLYKAPFTRTECKKSRIYTGPFFTMASKSRGDDIDDDVRLFDIYGKFDENKLREAVIAVGGPDFFDTPVLSHYKGQEIIWRMSGKVDSQAIAFVWDQNVYDHDYYGSLSTGGSCFFMHAFSRAHFGLNRRLDQTATDLEELALDKARREMDAYLNFTTPVWQQSGFSDIEWYLRWGRTWEYTCKFRRVDAGFRLGGIIPSGITRDIYNPVSLALGGDGLWGLYLAADVQCELKEDFSAGILLQYNQRFAKTKQMRIPVKNEFQLYGAAVGDLKITPGATFIFSPYVQMDGVRDGFGFRAEYTIVTHLQDSFKDERPVQEPPATLDALKKYSNWTAEYVTVDAFYDFGKVRGDNSSTYLISIMADIPIKFLVAERVPKTARLSLGFQFIY